MNVIKRDGQEVVFEKQKIFNAIMGAVSDIATTHPTDKAEELAKGIADKLEGKYSRRNKTFSVEEIQDDVETELMRAKAYEVAKAYVRWRYLHKMARSQYEDLMDAVAEKLKAENAQNQNANVDEHSFGGRLGEAGDVVTKRYALEYLVSPMAKSNHENNEIYIHDLNSYAIGSHNCLSIPFDHLLAEGFNTRQTDVRPARSINTALQLVAVIFQLQSLQQFGGVSATHLDWTLVPYVRMSFKKHMIDGFRYIRQMQDDEIKKVEERYPLHEDGCWYFDDEALASEYPDVWRYAMAMTQKEAYQAVEGMYHNLNTLQSRSGCQLPFTSINYGTCTLPEGRMIIKALLEVSIKGIGKLHRTSIFPCGIFQLAKGVNRKEGDPNYDMFQLALRSTSTRLYPNYANIDWSGNEGYDTADPMTYFSTMGCRTANGYDINGLSQQKDGRGNICPVTIILPTLAMEAREAAGESGNAVEEFMKILDIKIHEARDMLLERFEWICSQDPASAKFMYENNVMAGYVPEEGIRSALKHGTLAVGMLGMAECLQALIGCDQTEGRGMELAKRICQLYKDRCAEFKKSTSLNFGVYYTPAENLCYTAMKKFKEKYGVIPHISENDYFTNSIHCPVWIDMTPFQKIDLESQLTGYSNAGCITYVELDSACKYNLQALEEIVNYAMDKDIPYFAVNVPNDQCMDCGYCDVINDACPECGGTNIKRLRRVTGYLTNDYKTAFNLGKQQEVEMRVKHDKLLRERYAVKAED